MPETFETPYDGYHNPLENNGNDWRSMLERPMSYGNFAGPGNRNEHTGGNYQPIDGMDAAAQRHDEGYGALGNHSMWSWDGIKNVAGADRRLADETDQEMATNGDKYSGSAQTYSKAMRGIFGGRASVVEGTNWLGNKAGEARDGIGNFVDSARDWHSLGDAGRGIANGAASGAKWLGNTAAQGWNGVKNTASYFGGLGPAGIAGAVVGGGEALAAGGVHLLGQAGRGIANGVSSVAHTAGGAISSGARTVGGAISNGAHAVGGAISSGAQAAGGAIASGAQAAGGAIASGASAAWSGARAAGGAIAGGAQAAGGAIAGGAKKAWSWLRGG